MPVLSTTDTCTLLFS